MAVKIIIVVFLLIVLFELFLAVYFVRRTLLRSQVSTERTVEMAKKYGKQSERWIMGYNAQPEDFSQIDKVVDMYEAMGVDRLATWTYRGGLGTIVSAKDPLKLWDKIGENYKRVLKK